MTTDIGILLNLACLKYTGSYLPTSGGEKTSWTYILDDDKKKAKFNPYSGNLLSNPFKFEIQSHPIEQSIKRNLINDEIKQIFKKKITMTDIVIGMLGINIRELLSQSEITELVKIRDALIAQHEIIYSFDESFYRWINERLPQKIGELIVNPSTKTYEDVHNVYQTQVQGYIKGQIKLILASNAHNPVILKLLKKYKNPNLHPDRKKWGNLPYFNSQGDPHRFYLYSNQQNKFDELSTKEKLPPVKKSTWTDYFALSLSPCTSYHLYRDHNELLKTANARRRGFWDYVKKESGEYKPPEKENFEKRYYQSILQL